MARERTRNMVLAAVLTALLAVLSPHTIPVGPIPITLGVFGIAFVGAMLPPGWAACSIGVYIAIGVIGLPVFSGYRAGPQVLVGPTGGYIVGYFLLAFAVSFAVRRLCRLPLQLALSAAGMAACYLLGTLWYTVVSGAGFLSGLAVCVAPFVLPDCIKITLALLLGRQLAARMKPNRGGI